jgi:hypothetical protein
VAPAGPTPYVPNQRLVGNRFDLHRLFGQTGKELAAMTRPATIETKRELVEIEIDRVLERGRLLRLDGPSVCTLHVNLDDAMKEESDQQADLVRISGKSRSEFPEPTPGVVRRPGSGRAVTGIDVCRMFNAATHGQGPPRYLSTDHDPVFEAHRWTANLRISRRAFAAPSPTDPLCRSADAELLAQDNSA